jgi:hypothetical protein
MSRSFLSISLYAFPGAAASNAEATLPNLPEGCRIIR